MWCDVLYVRRGCSMIVYDLRTSRITMAYRSRLLVQPDALLLTFNLGYLIAVQQGCVVIWRVEDVASTVNYHKYMTDDFPADDQQLSDTDYYYDETVQDAAQPVSLSHSLSACRVSRKVPKSISIMHALLTRNQYKKLSYHKQIAHQGRVHSSNSRFSRLGGRGFHRGRCMWLNGRGGRCWKHKF